MKAALRALFAKIRNITSQSSRARRLRVVPHFSSGIVERAKRERAWKSPHARKGDTRRGERKIFLSPRRVSPFLAWGDFHARSRFAHSTILEEKWGTTRSLTVSILANCYESIPSGGAHNSFLLPSVTKSFTLIRLLNDYFVNYTVISLFVDNQRQCPS